MRQAGTRSFPEEAEELVVRLRRSKDRQVSSKALRAAVQEFVREYFSQTRPSFPANRCPELLNSLDACFQDLMRCTHARTIKSRYVRLLKDIAKTGREVDLALLSPAVQTNSGVVGGSKEALIIATLRKLSPSAACSFEQGLKDLASQDRVSWRGSVVEFREALREVLDHMAPDKDVTAMPGYKQEKETHGPTMKQKVMFILKSRKTPSSEAKAVVDSVNVVDEMVGNFVRSVYQRSSTATHVAAGKEEANRVREYVTLALLEILALNQYDK